MAHCLTRQEPCLTRQVPRSMHGTLPAQKKQNRKKGKRKAAGTRTGAAPEPSPFEESLSSSEPENPDCTLSPCHTRISNADPAPPDSLASLLNPSPTAPARCRWRKPPHALPCIAPNALPCIAPSAVTPDVEASAAQLLETAGCAPCAWGVGCGAAGRGCFVLRPIV